MNLSKPMYNLNFLLICFCLFLGDLPAQVSSNLKPSILEIKEDDTHFSTLTKERLFFGNGLVTTDLNANEQFLRFVVSPLINTGWVSEFTPEKLSIRENVYFAPGGDPSDYSYSTELFKSRFFFNYENLDDDVKDSWVLQSSNANEKLSFVKIKDYGAATTYANGLTLKDNEGNPGTPVQVGIYGQPNYTFHITHQTTPGDAFIGGNGLGVSNNGTNKRDWLHYVVNNTGQYNWYADGAVKAAIDYSTGNWVPLSDKKMKKNIRSLKGDMLQKIKQLNPTTYQFKNQESDRKVYGLIAQEVQKIFPDIVIEMDEKGETIGVSYTELIPILTVGIQEQQNFIEEQASQIDHLENNLDQLRTEIQELKALVLGKGEENNKIQPVLLSDAKLFQNAPNPFHGNTRIPYFLPQHTKNAVLKITNIQGHIIKTIPLSQKGEGSVQLDTNALSAGTYQYSLWIDGQLIDSHQMILAIK